MTDPHLPQLETALNPSLMAGVLGRQYLHRPGEYRYAIRRPAPLEWLD
jgi:hypothetical protein